MAWRILVISFLVAAGTLKAASPEVGMISPPGGQRGSECEVLITGEHLSDARGLLFYSPGIEATAFNAAGDGRIVARVKIAADCALGQHELRVWTATGLSDLRTFYVGPFPNVFSKEPNGDVAHAQPLPLNSTVNGVIKEEGINYFAVEMKKGQRLTAEVEGMRLGATMFDPWLAIMTKDGRQIVANDDNSLLLQDPLASTVIPEDGTYLIAVRESSWGGGSKCAYRLHIGAYSQPLVVFPLGGQVGERIAFKFAGDPAGTPDRTITLPAAPDERYPVFAEADGVPAPAANVVRVSPFPNVLALEPNEDRAHATGSDKPLPLAFNGVLRKPGKAGFFKFIAKKDQQLDVNVYARRLRSPLDSVLQIYDSAGKPLAYNDDSEGLDSYLRFHVPADGEYYLSVRDQLRRGGDLFAYRVEVTPAVPSLACTIPEMVKDSQERQTIVVPRGNRFATTLRTKRSDFDGEFVLDAPGLPAGASFQAGPLAGDIVPVVYEAAPDAPVAARLCELDAHATDKSKPVRGRYDQEVDLVYGNPNNTIYYKAEVKSLAVAVADEAPFKLDVVAPKVPMLRGGAMDLKVVATRKEGFKGEITASMLYNPPGVGSQASVTIPAGQSEATIPLSATNDAKLNTWKIAVLGSSDPGKGKVWVSSQLADLQVAQPFVTGQIERASAEQGQKVEVVCKLTQNTPFPGKAKAQLMGLPSKVTAAPLEITSADQEARFSVATDPASPAGQHKGLFCQLIFETNGEKIVENTALDGVLRIDKPAGNAEGASK